MAESCIDDSFCSSPSTSTGMHGETNFQSYVNCEPKPNEGSSRHSGQTTHQSSLEEKLQELRRLCHEKKVEKKLLQKFRQNVQVAEFLHKHVFYPQYDDDDNEEEDESRLSQKQRKHIKQLLNEKEKFNDSITKLNKENRALEVEVLNDKLFLKDCVKDRNYIFNKAVQIYEKKEGRNSEFEKLDTTLGDVSECNLKCLDNESVGVKYEIATKVHRITELARVLHLLVSFSGVKWAHNADLLEIVLCTGELLNNDFDAKNISELKRIVDDVNHRLNHVKI